MESLSVDVLVVGGGPAGLAASITLARRSPLSTIVIERSRYDAPRAGETLSPGARGLLEYLGVLESFLADGHLPAYGTAASWGDEALMTRDFIMTPFGSGWHLDRRRFDARLAEEAERAGARVWRGSRAIRLSHEADGVAAAIDREGACVTVRARFLVDATGRSGGLAAQLGAERRPLDRQVAVLRMVELEGSAPVETQTLVEACPDGWWYSARVPGNGVVVGLMSDADLVRERGLWRARTWEGILSRTQHTSPRVKGGAMTGPPRAVAAGSACLSRLSGPRWIAVGDAAASHDPLSSSGIVRALDSGIFGARAVAAALCQDRRDEIQEHEARVRDGFRRFAVTWARYYGMETRFPGSAYWRRRQRAIPLDPRVVLVRRSNGAPPRLPLDLDRVDPALLLSLCEAPRPAHEIVARYRSRTPRPAEDAEIIVALQWLAGEGALAGAPAIGAAAGAGGQLAASRGS